LLHNRRLHGRPARSERTERGERTERSDRPQGDRPQRDNRRGESRTEVRNEVRAETAPELIAENNEARTERAPRGERNEGQGRRERGERGEGRRDRADRGERRHEDKAPSETAGTEPAGIVAESTENAMTENSATENTSERRERRSRDRYGRDRRERNAEPRQENAVEQENAQNSAALAAPSPETAPEERPAPRSYFERAQQAAAPVVTESAPVAPEPSVAMANPQASQASLEPLDKVASESTPSASVNANVESFAPAASVIEQAQTPQVQTPQVQTPSESVTQAQPKDASGQEIDPVVQGSPSVQAYTLPVARLQQVAHDSGLIWVNSDAEKIAAVQAAIAAEPQAARIPRERPPLVVMNEGPLVLVETRKDLSQLKVPF